MTTTKQLTVADFKSDLKPIWCAGCGDYGAINPFYQALVACDVDPKSTVNTPNFIFSTSVLHPNP